MPFGDRDRHRHAAREDDLTLIVCVPGIRDKHFIAWIDRGQEGQHDAFHGPRGDDDLVRRVDSQPVLAFHFDSDRLAECGVAESRKIGLPD